MRRAWRPLVSSLLALALAGALRAQAPDVSRDTRHRALGLLRARADYDRASAERARSRALETRGLASPAELEEREAAWTRARVELLQAALAALDDAPRLMIERAVRRRDADGRARVELVLAGAPGADAAVVRALAGLDDGVAGALAGPARAFVSLKAAPGADGAVIATPYEHVLPRLAPGARRRLTFALVRDAADVVVSVAMGSRVDERRILLEAGDGESALALAAAQLAQEGDLGTQVGYDVVLERLRDDVGAVRVAVAGLPAGAGAEVREGSDAARLSLVRFAPGEREKRLRVLVALPREAGGGVYPDSTLRFAVVATADGVPPSARGGAARAALELLPRGVPRAELRLDRLYAEGGAGDSVALAGTVRNAGTRRLAGARLRVEAPAGWTARVAPAELPALDVAHELPFRLMLLPAAGAAAGEYELRLQVDGPEGARPLDGEPRVVRHRVTDPPRRAGVLVALLLLAGTVGAGALVARRLAAR